jgi:pyridoxamine 5'-phosphate oxidase family protein
VSFNDQEEAYLRSQRLARIATISDIGQPDVAPVGFEFDGSDFFIGGMDLLTTRKYLNVRDGSDKVALVIDDLASVDPWSPRFVRVYGMAHPVHREGTTGTGTYLQIIPTVSWSWNLDGRTFRSESTEQFRPRKAVHQSSRSAPATTAGVRMRVGVDSTEAEAAVESFVVGLQAGHDKRDAEILNRQFASDIIWGSPYGAIIDGYDMLHPIHVGFQRNPSDKPPFRYAARHVLALSDDIVVAHIARLALDGQGEPLPPSADLDQPFSEMAMYVLVRREGQWCVAAGQNTPMRPGGAVTAAT